MNKTRYRLWRWEVISIIGMHLLLGGTTVVHAEDKAETVRNIIEQIFPGATITEIEEGELDGERITEVDFATVNGVAYEARISDNGEILTIEKDRD